MEQGTIAAAIPHSRCSLVPPPLRAAGGAQPGVHEPPRARCFRPRPRCPVEELRRLTPRRRAAADPSLHRRSSPLLISCMLRRGKRTTLPLLPPCFPSDRRAIARRRACGRATPPGAAASHVRAPTRPLVRPDELAVAYASSLTRTRVESSPAAPFAELRRGRRRETESFGDQRRRSRALSP